ncbi:hypothetical protein MPRG_31380 [Mycobacterium paragordonae]|uniref:Uncharacterized protein n=1 Tax=Mycobacterium paragordonae TaxID=1389713 RepID=A0ABQ1C6F7_9MYCO|nr:hypothetical protein MPRG_31380 [Mycobacterium paragordonae]
MHQGDPVGEGGEPAAGNLQRARVAVESDHAQSRQFGQKQLRMPARTECGVDQDGSGAIGVAAGQRRGKQLDTPLGENRDMSEITCAGTGLRHHDTSRAAAIQAWLP